MAVTCASLVAWAVGRRVGVAVGASAVKPDPKCAALSGYTLEVARSKPAASGTTVQAKCLGFK